MPLGAGDVLHVDQVVVKKYVHFEIVNQVYVNDQEPKRGGSSHISGAMVPPRVEHTHCFLISLCSCNTWWWNKIIKAVHLYL